MTELPLSKFNEGSTFTEKDIMKLTSTLNKVNMQLHNYCKDDMEKKMCLLYEIGTLLVSQVMSCVQNKDDHLADMMNDVQEDLVSYMDFHDANHKIRKNVH